MDSGSRALVVGLGNPGREHRHNRHNIGFMVVSRLAQRHDIRLSQRRQQALLGDGRVAGRPVIVALPQTYMNRSGDAVGPLARYFRIAPAEVLVVYDELDLPFGTIRLREQGGAGGHNGMKSIINHLGPSFPRVRLGIGRPPGRMDPAAWVLQDFHQDDSALLEALLDEGVRAIETFLAEGIQLAMSRHNGALDETE